MHPSLPTVSPFIPPPQFKLQGYPHYFLLFKVMKHGTCGWREKERKKQRKLINNKKFHIPKKFLEKH